MIADCADKKRAAGPRLVGGSWEFFHRLNASAFPILEPSFISFHLRLPAVSVPVKALEKVCDHAPPSSRQSANATASSAATARGASIAARCPPCRARLLPPGSCSPWRRQLFAGWLRRDPCRHNTHRRRLSKLNCPCDQNS